MDGLQPIQLNLRIFAGDSTDDDIDRMTRQLLSELREMDVEAATLARGEVAPIGSKGDPVTIGAIALAVLPAALPRVVDAVQAWISRGSGRTVKFKGKVAGQAVEFEGSAEDLQKLLGTLAKAKRKWAASSRLS